MSRPLQLTPWQGELASRFPDLPAPVVAVLALYSFGMLLAKVCGLSSVALLLATHLDRPFFALRKRLREFYLEAHAKSGVHQGQKRQDFDVSTCFAPLLRWILSLWSGRQLALAIDVTNLGERFHVLCVSVVVCGLAIPVAWKVLPGGVKDPWNPHWQVLLTHLKKAVPDDWMVIVLSDRGLESAWLFAVIKDQGWHPLMRAKKGGKFRPAGWGRSYGLGELVRRVGESFNAEGRAYGGGDMPCTLLARYAEGYDEPWFVLTDLPPEAADAVWYALRTWIEQGFKVIKGGGWDWEKTRMEDPARVERLWLVMAVATLWVVAVGAADEARQEAEEESKKAAREMAQSLEQAKKRQEQEQKRRDKQEQGQQAQRQRKERREELKREQRERRRSQKKASKSEATTQQEGSDKGPAQEEVTPTPAEKTKKARKRVKRKEGARQRIHRVSARGLAVLSALWQQGQNRLPQHLHPEPWPQPSHSASTLTEEEFLSQQT
jgi:Transposase DDE domain